MHWPEDVFYISLFVFAYIVGPTALVWGLVSFVRRRHEKWTPTSFFSVSGFLIAFLSAVVGLLLIFCGLSGAFENLAHMEIYYRFIKYGGVLSILALLFAIGGIWKPHRLRWQAPISALGTLAFWIIAAAWT
jgi:hypothetical protein